MPQLVIEVDPTTLPEPDAELRHELPALIEAASAGRLESTGYAYDSDERLHLYLSADDIVPALQTLKLILESSLITGTDLGHCRVGVRDNPGQPFHVVLPEGKGGTVEALDIDIDDDDD